MREPTVPCLTCGKRRVLSKMATDITCRRCTSAVAEANRRVPASQSR